jgi:hypothetical protein
MGGKYGFGLGVAAISVALVAHGAVHPAVCVGQYHCPEPDQRPADIPPERGPIGPAPMGSQSFVMATGPTGPGPGSMPGIPQHASVLTDLRSGSPVVVDVQPNLLMTTLTGPIGPSSP